MKNFIFIIISIVILMGCIAAPQIPTEICKEFDPATSYLLKVSSEKNIPLNEVYYGLLDITAIGLITEAIKKEQVKEFMTDLGQWYLDHYPVSYMTLLDYMMDREKAEGLAGILNRRIRIFNSFVIISNYDDCLLRAGWNNAMDSLFLR